MPLELWLLLSVLQTASTMVIVSSSNSVPSSSHPLHLSGLRSVQLQLFDKKELALSQPTVEGSSFSAILKRRNDIELYGKPVVPEPNEPNFATLTVYPNSRNNEISGNTWDSTLLLQPHTPTTLEANTCFIAMNRFFVKESCYSLFEERWAERNSQLPNQPGFVTFSLLRNSLVGTEMNKSPAAASANPCFLSNYASCTVWASHDMWMEWRNGDGRYSHAQNHNRTPVSAWMHRKASPIFWDGMEAILSDRGV